MSMGVKWSIGRDPENKQYWIADEEAKEILSSPPWMEDDVEEWGKEEPKLNFNMEFVVAAYNTAITLNPEDPKAVIDWLPNAVRVLSEILNAEPKDFEKLYIEAHTVVKKMNPSFKEKNPLVHLLLTANQGK
jgi:hypothetical protein